MSARALNWAWAAEPRTAAQKLVLAALADRADDDGYCWPSLRWLAAKCAPTSERTVRRSVDELVEQGLLAKVRRRRNDDGSLGTWLMQLPVTSGHGWPVGDPDQWPRVASDPVATGGHSERRSEDLEPSIENTTSDEVVRTRPRDPIWDALVDLFGAAPVGLERGRWNKAAQSLRQARASPDQVRDAARAYRTVMPEGTLMTPTAIAANWTILTATPKTRADLDADAFRRRMNGAER